MFQIKGLANCLKNLTQNKIITDIALRHKRKFFCKYDNIWYEFPNSGAIIVPFNVANEYAKKHKLFLEEPLVLNSIDFAYLNKTIKRIPIVAILGHFNHGKTTLIDAYGGTNLVQQEIHAITQVIRSRMLSLYPTKRPLTASGDSLSEDEVVTFIDTPGQEIFYRMRDYGAAIADLALLVVSADDGICQQTEESIGIVESLGIPVVVCINKIDLPSVTAIPTRVADVETQAREYNVLEHAEFVAISAKYSINLDVLSGRIQQTIKNLEQTELLKAVQTTDLVSIENRLQKMFICGTGTVLNIWSSRQTGVVLHLIVQHGEVSVGTFFSAGGWSGSVRKVVRDNQAVVQSATAGMGVHLTVVMSKQCDDPRPLGDRIFFHGPRNGAKLNKTDKEKSREAADAVMLQNQLQAKISSYAISDALAEHYWLEDAHERVKNSVEYHRKRALAAAEEEEEEGDAASGANSSSDEDTEEEEEAEDPDECRVVVKADTDLSLNTIMDARDEAMTRFEAGGVGARPPNRVVFSGVGDVTMRDVTIAQAANALIVTYGVGVEADAARLSAQSGGIRMLGIDCMQDAVDAVLVPGPSSNKSNISKDQSNIMNTLVRKPKRRSTTFD